MVMVLVLHSLVLGGYEKELEVYGVKKPNASHVGYDWQRLCFLESNNTGTISFSLLWVKDDVSMPDGLEWPLLGQSGRCAQAKLIKNVPIAKAGKISN